MNFLRVPSCPLWLMLLAFGGRVLIRIPALLISRDVPRVVLEQIVQVLTVQGIGLAIGIPAHCLEGQRLDRETVGRIEIHIFLVPADQEKIIPSPATRQSWKFRGIEFQRDLVAGAEHDKPVRWKSNV